MHRGQLLAIVLLLFSPCGCGRGSGPDPASAKSADRDDALVAITLDPPTPREGRNEIRIELKQSDGSALLHAHPQVVAVMPAMGAMSEMRSEATIDEAKPGVYVARYFLSMEGQWDLYLSGAGTDREIRRHWRLRTGASGFQEVTETDANLAIPSQADSASGAPAPTTWVDPAKRNALGIRVLRVERHVLTASRSFSGQVAFDETRMAEVSMRFNGRIRRLAAIQVGTPVQAGEVLCVAYSPEMISAQQDFLNVNARMRGGDPSAMSRDEMDLLGNARKRLEGWDLPGGLVDSVQRTHQIVQEFPILAPISGVVTEKAVNQGAYFAPGEVLWRIATLDPLRVVVNLPEIERGFANVGTRVVIHDRSDPRLLVGGTIAVISAALDMPTRTLPVTIACPNPHGMLRPGAFVDVEFTRSIGSGLSVPEGAILHSNDLSYVCVDLGSGRFGLRRIDPGMQIGQEREVRRGLDPGDRVVIGGQFLIASQLRLSPTEAP